MRPLISAFRLPIMGLALVVAAAPALADAIDGDWCMGADHMMIDGPNILTPGRNRIAGDYFRYRFNYVVPANEPGGGGEVKMVMIRGTETVHVDRPGGDRGNPKSGAAASRSADDGDREQVNRRRGRWAPRTAINQPLGYPHPRAIGKRAPGAISGRLNAIAQLMREFATGNGQPGTASHAPPPGPCVENDYWVASTLVIHSGGLERLIFGRRTICSLPPFVRSRPSSTVQSRSERSETVSRQTSVVTWAGHDAPPHTLQHGMRMSGFKFLDHNDRRQAANDAKKAALERFKNRVGPGHPDFEKMQAERVRLAAERDERHRAAKEDKVRQEAEAKAAAAAAEETRIKAERTAYLAKLALDKEMQADQKASRDARYAARKAAKAGKKGKSSAA